MASILRAWNLVVGGARKITSVTLGNKEALCTTLTDASGKVPGESGYTGPVVQQTLEDSSTGDALVQTGETVGDKKAGHVIVVGSGGGNANPACFVSITESNLTANVYTITGTPAVGYDIINDSAGPITVAVSDGTTTITKTLNPDDSEHQIFEIAIETITFSAGAVFRADILR